MEIRAARAEDLPAMLAIRNDVVATTTSIYDRGPTALDVFTVWFEERIAEDYPVLVADAGEIVGYSTFGRWRPRWGYRFTVEHSVHVRADRRNAGIGKALIEALLAIAKDRKLHTMIAMIDAAAAASIALHAKLGFVEVGRFREISLMGGEWLDLVAMQRMIASEPNA